jgi:Leucine-rich repeat (LRR) protein
VFKIIDVDFYLQISDLPPSLFHCHELKELDLCDNDLMTIPTAVGSLTRLCRLDLSRNGKD